MARHVRHGISHVNELWKNFLTDAYVALCNFSWASENYLQAEENVRLWASTGFRDCNTRPDHRELTALKSGVQRLSSTFDVKMAPLTQAVRVAFVEERDALRVYSGEVDKDWSVIA